MCPLQKLIPLVDIVGKVTTIRFRTLEDIVATIQIPSDQASFLTTILVDLRTRDAATNVTDLRTRTQ
jgi:hypothetical protein